MAWDAAKPAGTDTLRVSDDSIRANWTAIEEGGVPYDTLKLETQGSAPTPVADYGFLYTKDVSSKAELHYIDEDSNVIVITSAGSLGTASTDILSSKIDVDNLRLDGNTVISTDSNGDINLTPDGTGSVVVSKVDINAGAIDGATIGAASTSTGAFTTLTASTSITAAGLAYPTSDGSADQFMKTDGAGTLSFGSVTTPTMTYVSTTTISNDATVDFANLNEASATYVFILINVKPVTDSVYFRALLSTDNGSSFITTANYSEIGNAVTPGSGLLMAGDNKAHMSLTDSSQTIGNNTNEGYYAEIKLLMPQDTGQRKVLLGHYHFRNTSAAPVAGTFHNDLIESSAVDAIQFYFSSGNLSSGKILLYKIAGS